MKESAGSDACPERFLEEIVRRLIEAYQPERIYLFGSKARGESTPDSDYDLLVVVPDDASEERRDSDLAYRALRDLDRRAGGLRAARSASWPLPSTSCGCGIIGRDLGDAEIAVARARPVDARELGAHRAVPIRTQGVDRQREDPRLAGSEVADDRDEPPPSIVFQIARRSGASGSRWSIVPSRQHHAAILAKGTKRSPSASSTVPRTISSPGFGWRPMKSTSIARSRRPLASQGHLS